MFVAQMLTRDCFAVALEKSGSDQNLRLSEGIFTTGNSATSLMTVEAVDSFKKLLTNSYDNFKRWGVSQATNLCTSVPKSDAQIGHNYLSALYMYILIATLMTN